MTDSMIERVAEAIYYSQRAATAREKDQWGKAGEMQRAGYLADARAAIEAMRTPTEAMCDATDCLDVYWAYESGGRPGMPSDVWSTMIYAALKEKP